MHILQNFANLFDFNKHIVHCRFTEMGVTESYCNSVESSSLNFIILKFIFLILSQCC